LTFDVTSSSFVRHARIRNPGSSFAGRLGHQAPLRPWDQRGIVKIDASRYTAQLDVNTLVCARGRAFPLSMLASRMMCPNCGERRVLLTFEVPGAGVRAFIPQVYRR
jgi:hypothetical protein